MRPRKPAVVAPMWLGLTVVLAVVVLGWGSALERPRQALGEFLSLSAMHLLFDPDPPAPPDTGIKKEVTVKECSLGGSGSASLVGWSSVRAKLGKPVRLAGYGVWDFWRAAFQLQPAAHDAAQEIRGDLLVMDGGQSIWALVTLDAIGVPSILAAEMRSAIRSEILDVLKFGSSLPGIAPECFVVTIVASHSHSSADITGIWGGAADSWSVARNREQMRAQVYEPLLGALRRAASAAVADRRPARLAVDQDFYPTAARRERGALGSNLTRVWIERDGEGAGAAEKDAVIWIWNGHPATDVRSEDPKNLEFGDFPAAARQALGPAVHSFFLPGAIAGHYPVEQEGWREDLIGRVGQAPKQRPDTFSVRMRESDYCLAAENRLRRPLELWSAFGGGDGLSSCTAHAATFAVRLQSIRIAAGEAKGSPPFEIVFLPFETFVAVESGIRAAVHTDLRLVSLANGFEGHGLSQQQYDALMRGERESERAKPYHLFLALRSNIEDLVRDFLEAK